LPESEQPASEAAPEVVIAAMAQELEQAQAKASENWDRLLRLQAEMENLRKRSQRDIEHAHKYSLESIANELLAVRDSLELGLEAANSEEAEVEKIREGTELTLKMLVQAMEKFNIEQVDPLNEKFDPQWHQAMTVQEAEGKAPSTVLMVIQKGYKLNDRLLRPALVTVSK
jgi:molecular chaperone GrpE